MKSRKFSIVIPVYNTEKYLEECLLSITRQSFENIEVIVVDDGSTDCSLDIARAIARKDKRVHVLSQKNAGVSAARNQGINLANGDYLLFVDADDYLIGVNAISHISMAIKRDNADLTMFGHVTDLKKTIEAAAKKECYIGQRRLDFIAKSICNESINAPWGKVYRRDVITKNDIKFDESIKIGEDFLFNAAYVANCAGIYTINTPYYFYRTSNVNAVTKKHMPDKYRQLMYVIGEVANIITDMKSYQIANALQYIRIKNIFSCIKDLHRPECKMDYSDKISTIRLYKKENGNIIAKKVGIYPFLVSLIYSIASARCLYIITRKR